MINKVVQILTFGLIFMCSAQAAIDVYEFEDEQLRARYQTFVEEMRCPKCQNQNLAGSDSLIATDLRRELHRLLQEGKTDDEVVAFMVERYGDFILYKPRMQRSTLLLWLAPIGLLLLGVIIVVLIARGSSRKTVALSDEERARLDALIHDSNQEK